MLAGSDFDFVFGIGDFIACAAKIDKIERYQAMSLHARAATAGPAAAGRVSYRSTLWFNLCQAGAALYFHDLVAQQRGALEFEICGGLLHFLLKLAEQFRDVEIAASFANYRRFNFASAQNCVQTLLHGAPDRLRRNAVFFVVLHLLGAPVF